MWNRLRCSCIPCNTFITDLSNCHIQCVCNVNIATVINCKPFRMVQSCISRPSIYVSNIPLRRSSKQFWFAICCSYMPYSKTKQKWNIMEKFLEGTQRRQNLKLTKILFTNYQSYINKETRNIILRLRLNITFENGSW